MFNVDSKSDTLLTMLVVFSIVLVTGSLVYMYSTPQQTDQYTEFYLLMENSDGELVASDYPKNIDEGSKQEIIIGISNNEHRSIQYSVVILLQEVNTTATTIEVHNQEHIGTHQTEYIPHGETRHINYGVEPTITGENLRLTYLLYKGDPPRQPTLENSYQDTHIWISVEETNAQDPINIKSDNITNQSSTNVN